MRDESEMITPSESGTRPFLHRSISDLLRQRLRSGQLGAGMKLPTVRRLADEYKVSTMTIRRALSTLEEEGRVHRIPGVGMFAGERQTSNSSRQTVVAFLAGDLSSPFQVGIARGAARAAQQRGWSIQMLDAQFDAELEAGNIRRLPDFGVTGLLVLPPFSSPDTVETITRVSQEDIAVVLMDQTCPGLSADLVCSDHEGGAYRATRYLLQRGHSRVILLTHAHNSWSVAARGRGFERALREADMEPSPDQLALIEQSEQDKGYREQRKWYGSQVAILPHLQKVTMPVGVLAIDAYAAWGVYEACEACGLRIPEDVSVIGFDDSEIAHAMKPPTTIISQRTEEIGKTAVELLEERLGSSQQQKSAGRRFSQVLLDVDLIERGSVSIQGRSLV